MIITNVLKDTSFVKATIPKSLLIRYADNHKLSLQEIQSSLNLSSSSSEKVVIQEESQLIAKIIENENL